MRYVKGLECIRCHSHYSRSPTAISVPAGESWMCSCDYGKIRGNGARRA